VQVLTNKHTHLFPVNTEEERILQNKAITELERDGEFLKHGNVELLENISLNQKSTTDTPTPTPTDTLLLDNSPMYNKVLDVSDLNELSSLAD
jgi:hypothetical protein